MSELAGDRNEVARRIGASVDVVDQLTAEGRIPHIRLGPRKTIYPWAAVERWLLSESFASMNTESPLLGLVADGR
jgi:excisionase family DNA binding protein